MNHLILSGSWTSLLTFILGLFALLRGPRKKTNQMFTCYSWSIALWSFCFTQLPSVPAPWDLWYGRLLHVGCVFIPVLFYHFAMALAGAEKQAKGAILAAYVIAVTYNLLNLVPGVFTAEIVQRPGYAYPKPIGLLYFSYFVFFALLVGFGLAALRKAVRSIADEQAKGLRLFMVLTLLGYLGGLNNFLIMIDVQLFPLFPYGLYLVAIYGVAAMYVLKRYDLLGIRPHPSSPEKPGRPADSAPDGSRERREVETSIAR